MSKKNKVCNETEIEKDELKETLEELKENNEINPDLKEFFDVVKEKKIELEKEDTPKEEIKVKKKHGIGSFLKVTICLFALVLGIIYFIISFKDAINDANYMQKIITNSLLLFALISLVIGIISNKNIFGSLTIISIIGIISLNLLISKDVITLKTLTVMKEFRNASLIDIMKWAKENNIEIEKIYEYSDNVLEGYIITQDILPNTVLKNIKKITLTISNGPNYDKELILSNMIGLTIDDLNDFISKNHLKDVTINYTVNDELQKDTVISQSIKGQIKRNTPITFEVSLGSLSTLENIKLIDLVNKSEFDATLYLKRNGIKYNITYDFSETIKKGYVISQDKQKNEVLTPLNDTVNIVVSKGKKITVPDFSSKTVEDVIEWITKNNLRVAFTEHYDLNIAKGKLIGIDYNANDIISEGTKITINTSLGALTIPSFKSLAEFYGWADTNGVRYSQTYEFNNSVPRGNIIKLSKNTNAKIDPINESLVVTISYGAPVTIPNFKGMNKASIQAKCSQIGLSCGFNYVGYSNTVGKDIAVSQNKGAGGKVISGTSITISLSKGPAQVFNIYIKSEWFGNTANETINSLRYQLNSACPDVNFVFATKPHNSARSGLIHEDSPIKGGDNTFKQGETYTIWIVQ